MLRSLLIVSSSFAALTNSPTAFAQTAVRVEAVAQQAQRWPALDRHVEGWLARRRLPGLSLAVIENGRLVHLASYGLTSLEGAIPVTPDTRFQAASISKAVAAVTLLQLVDRGLIALDDPVDPRLIGWHLPTSEAEQKLQVTLRRLLSHTAGINVPSFDGSPAGIAVPSLIDVLRGTGGSTTPAVSVRANPQAAWAYSGGGYSIAQLLAESVAGRSFSELTDELVFKPLGMSHSEFAQPLSDISRPSSAQGYLVDRRPVPGGANNYAALAAGGLWSTPKDLARFLIAVRASARGERSILSPRLAEEALRNQLGGDGTRRWGLGFRLTGEGDRLRFGHDGRNMGFDSDMSISMAGGNGVVIMTNGNDNSAMFANLTRFISRLRNWSDTPATPEPLTTRAVPMRLAVEVEGLYQRMSGDVLAIRTIDRRLYRMTDNLPDVEYRLTENGELVSAETGERLQIRKDSRGRIVGLEQGEGPSMLSSRIGPLPSQLSPLRRQADVAHARQLLAALSAGGSAVRTSGEFSDGFKRVYGGRPPIDRFDQAERVTALHHSNVQGRGIILNGETIERVSYFRVVNSAMSMDTTMLIFFDTSGRIADVTLM